MSDKMQKYLKDRITESEDGVMTYFTGKGNYRLGKYRTGFDAKSRNERIERLKTAKEILWSEGILTGDQQKIIDEKLGE